MNKEPHQSSGRRKGTDSCSKTQEYDEWEAKSAFQQLTYWNHDTLPSSADPLHLCFDWLPLSAAIHGSISAEEVAAMAKEQGILLPGKAFHTQLFFTLIVNVWWVCSCGLH
jgi:hypothetical protein